MLIKVLSFIASVLSNTRYKAVLIPSVVVVLAITSLSTVLLLNETRPPSTAAVTTQADLEPQTSTDTRAAKQNSGGQQQNPKDDSQQITDTPAGNTQPSTSSGSPRTSDPHTPVTSTPQTAFGITVDKTSLALSRDSTSVFFTASSNDNSSVFWTIAPVLVDGTETNPIEVISDNVKDPAGSIMFRFRTAPHAKPGQYGFVVTAKDSARSLTSSKTITLTINP